MSRPVTALSLTFNAYALSNLMQFDHVIEVHGGIASDSNVYATSPVEVSIELDADGSVTAEAEADMIQSVKDKGWELLTGYTGQYSYNGPMMHQSEFIGGRMAHDILSTDGYYVAIYPYYHTADPDEDVEPDTWMVAHKPF